LPSLASIRWIVGTEHPRKLGELPLIRAQEGPGGAHLGGGQHLSSCAGSMYQPR
jgi:hypothetical protein